MVTNGAGVVTLPSGALQFAVDVTPKRNSDASFNGLVKLSGTVSDPDIDVDKKVVEANALVGAAAWLFGGKASVLSRQDRMERCTG